MKIFVDTNIFLDLILQREHCDKSLLILNAIEKKLFSGVVLDISILNIDYIAKKQIKEIKDFLKLINKQFEVVGATNVMIEDALEIDNNDLEDNLQYIAAKHLDCTLIITNDKRFLVREMVILSSSEFVDQYL